MGLFTSAPETGPEIPPRKAQEIFDSQRSDELGVIHHGVCIGCIYRAGNNRGEGIRWCAGCRYFDGIRYTRPDRRVDGGSR